MAMYEIDFDARPEPIHIGCGGQVSGQWDTISEESYWRCEECDECFTIDGRRAYIDTCVPIEEGD